MSQAVIGIDKSDVGSATAAPKFRLGTRASYDDPVNGYQEFIYGRANGAITGAGFICVEQAGFDFALLTSSNGGFGTRLGAAQAVLADNQYGWFQVYGRGDVRTLASAAAFVRLNTTATGGALDDDGTAGAEVVNGLVISVATGGAAATNPNGIFSYPTVGVTL